MDFDVYATHHLYCEYFWNVCYAIFDILPSVVWVSLFCSIAPLILVPHSNCFSMPRCSVGYSSHASTSYGQDWLLLLFSVCPSMRLATLGCPVSTGWAPLFTRAHVSCTCLMLVLVCTCALNPSGFWVTFYWRGFLLFWSFFGSRPSIHFSTFLPSGVPVASFLWGFFICPGSLEVRYSRPGPWGLCPGRFGSCSWSWRLSSLPSGHIFLLLVRFL